MTTNFIGQPVSRVDGRQKVTGRATYAAEFQISRTWRTPQSFAARSRAAGSPPSTPRQQSAAPGVIAVLTHRNAPRSALSPHKGGSTPRLASACTCCRTTGAPPGPADRARRGDTLEQAQHAAMLVRVTYAAETADHRRVTRAEPVMPTQQKTDQGDQPPETGAATPKPSPRPRSRSTRPT
jgi:xanthine dehydrogenase YagR molybdenum-binding subunit